MARRDERSRLDQPRAERRQLRPSYDPEAFGRLTERVARFLGTGRYLVIQTVLIVIWIVVNVLPGIPHFDPYTFTFLTLVLSLQAAYAAPLILLAQNRQDDRDRANLVEDREQARRALEDTEYLARELADVRRAVGDVVTRDFLREQLRDLLDELGEARRAEDRDADRAAARAASKAKKRKRRAERELDPEQVREEPLLVSEPQQPDEPHDDDPHDERDDERDDEPGPGDVPLAEAPVGGLPGA